MHANGRAQPKWKMLCGSIVASEHRGERGTVVVRRFSP